MPRRFHLNRIDDETGISGKGIVTNGIEFDDGSVVMMWNTDISSVTLYNSMEDVIYIHGHNGKTVVLWADDEGFDVFPAFVRFTEALDYLRYDC